MSRAMLNELLGALRRDKRPDASAETRTKCRRRIGTELARHADESNRLGHLVAQQALDSALQCRAAGGPCARSVSISGSVGRASSRLAEVTVLQYKSPFRGKSATRWTCSPADDGMRVTHRTRAVNWASSWYPPAVNKLSDCHTTSCAHSNNRCNGLMLLLLERRRKRGRQSANPRKPATTEVPSIAGRYCHANTIFTSFS
ncbi:MAG: hypothetical protein ABI969_20340, partial [bacterium]